VPATTLALICHDPDLATDTLTSVFAPEQPVEVAGRLEDFDFELQLAEAGDLATGRVRQTSRTRSMLEPVDCFVTASVVRGGAGFDTAHETLSMRAGDVGRYPDEAAAEAVWDDLDATLVRLPTSVLARVAEERTGVPGDGLRFDALAPVSPVMAQRWRTATTWLQQQMTDPSGALDEPLLLATTVDRIAAAALMTFPNTTMHLGELPAPAQVSPSAMRRAVEFVDGNADRPISVSEVAAAAHATGPSMEEAFHHYYGTTEAGYVREVRLHGAHRELQVGDEEDGTSVAGVAAHWGFARPDRFADMYGRRYAETPGQTLIGMIAFA
jgi:AraC-like DNA-binding protein